MAVDSKKDSILIIAAEASSCMYAKLFIKEWKKFSPSTHFYGVGDKEMAASGMECQGFAEEMAVVGLQEVIRHYPLIKKCADDVLDKTKEYQPRFALLLDYPGFNLRLAKKLKAQGISVVYYISPQLWAWKKGRVKQVEAYVDDMMVVFPFEVDFYKNYGIEVHFVGHPLVEVVEDEIQNLKIEDREKTVLGLMPGSRTSEINHNFQVQLAAAEILRKKMDLQVRVLVAPTLSVAKMKTLAGVHAKSIEFIQGPPTQMIQSCDVLLSASGTATLQVALCEKPMVVMYRMNPMTAFFAKLLVRSVDAFCIVNLIAGKKIVPELFQGDANAENLASHLEPLIGKEDSFDVMMTELNKVKVKLGAGGATKKLTNYLRAKYSS